ncbi:MULTISPECIES: SDR family NAD(P)-dependent oxidoreductase [Thalassospira]|jgi:NAD(P)-dependent dehydrogenase (short-subunit alcohol dehydrogenase family)|uniref:3-oxoacyl-ACP reductase n=1 Tax=Thalassospira profundimaris TaxID=502049 RepID=A0A367V4Z1_9PROT|nr:MULTISPECIES: SDR family NAD(P)-dependent oxidoreductase [Thalassospira]MBC44928.1 NAD(P)-dependent oxidoreductase [Thalassospira sp.]MBR9900565.1 SDR family oxidoreductase [Rhodospirillales bacterium]KZB69652.1 3-oxoacyl-ACP reductase [Thalassospira sp. MCCC 1A01148]RCK19350.1 3-oxoacyl-ACP reductase [Thalassospira profundimaris]HAI30937.1 SDR family NAD(P)-dependent oxidoreductase [Thalassospira sp.]|tara:strand:- start:3774 stop:4535 length:762 start_codon:yes stop_codon:yes gene_type:complete
MTASYHDIDGKSVLVTGGASGIGASIVRAFCAQGARVGFFDIDDAAAQKLIAAIQDEYGVTPVYKSLDLRQQSSISEAVREMSVAIGPIEVLVNNAARDDRHTPEDIDPEKWRDGLDVNLNHHFFCAQAVAPGMKEKGSGSIINFSSVSYMMGLPDLVTYETAKAGIIGLTRALARDWGGHGIRVNAVTPGCIITQRQLDLWISPADEERIQEQQCVKRRLVGDDVAQMVLFLASDVSSACSSQNFIVDGGIV